MTRGQSTRSLAVEDPSLVILTSAPGLRLVRARPNLTAGCEGIHVRTFRHVTWPVPPTCLTREIFHVIIWADSSSTPCLIRGQDQDKDLQPRKDPSPRARRGRHRNPPETWRSSHDIPRLSSPNKQQVSPSLNHLEANPATDQTMAALLFWQMLQIIETESHQVWPDLILAFQTCPEVMIPDHPPSLQNPHELTYCQVSLIRSQPRRSRSRS